MLTILLICFIFSNSTRPRSESAEQSGMVAEFLKPLIDPQDKINDSVFHHYVRKAAHFVEFAALGFSLMGLSDSLPWMDRKKQRLILPLLASLLVAATDEIIQIFAPLRGPGVKDVLLNFCGGAVGVFGMAVLLMLIRWIKGWKRKRSV